MRIAALLLLAACAPDDRCDAMCDAALARYEGCLEDAGLSWGPSVGYTSPADYTDWCETWVWEARQTDREASCDSRLTAFRDGDCSDYYAAWASE